MTIPSFHRIYPAPYASTAETDSFPDLTAGAMSARPQTHTAGDFPSRESFEPHGFPPLATQSADMSDPTSHGNLPASRRSSVSSASTGFQDERPSQPTPPSAASASPSQTQQVPVDPLSRQYPKPARDIDVAEALAREPPRWSLGYWTKNAKEQRTPEQTREARARKLEEAKRELLQMARPTGAKR